MKRAMCPWFQRPSRSGRSAGPVRIATFVSVRSAMVGLCMMLAACDDGPGEDPNVDGDMVLDTMVGMETVEPDATDPDMAETTDDGSMPDLEPDATTTPDGDDATVDAPDGMDTRDTVDSGDTTPDVMMPGCGGVECGPTEVCCNDVCVDLQTSNGNCGACGIACPAGEQCSDGRCRCGTLNSCEPFGDACCQTPDGSLECKQVEIDHANCGTCGRGCEFSESCFGGECACIARDGALEVCGEGENCCPNIGCRNLMTDPTSCGGCGIFCGAGELCVDGACTCGGTSVAGDSVCNLGEICCGEPGMCRPANDPVCVCGGGTCGSGQTCCDLSTGGESCVRPARDVEHCGACGVECAAGESCRGGTCGCQNGLADCDGNAANGCETSLDTDTANCGACGSACPAGTVCDGNGQCAANCQTGLLFCGGECVNPTNDVRFCGDCQTACPGGEVCDGTGACGVECQVGRTQCLTPTGIACKDLLSDHTACGSCTQRCGLARVCDGHGQCGLTCQPGLTECNRDCVNLDWNAVHCGACGVICGPGEVCNGGGQCAPTCLPGLVDCGGNCVDLDSEFAACGACGNACSPGQSCQEGQCVVECSAGSVACTGTDGVQRCVDLQNNASNCGACGNTCGTQETCLGGICVDGCPTGTTLCGGACVDLDSDPTNCGGCGTLCGAGEACVLGMGGTGQCVAVNACAPPRTSCPSGSCSDHDTDPSNCGGCGTACGPTEVCLAGACTCAQGLADCDGPDGVCETVLESDPANCGGCGVVCGAEETCDQGTCACSFGFADSNGDGTCDTPILVDPSNCGAVGVTCSTGESCQAGQCQLRVGRRIDLSDSGSPSYSAGCAIDSSGGVWCWGAGESGQLGDGYQSVEPGYASELPRPVVGLDGSGPSSTAVDVAVGQQRACAVLETGAVVCWGSASQGGLGCGTQPGCSNEVFQPIGVVGLDGVVATAVDVEAGDRLGCAILDTGAVQCWGVDFGGRQGNGSGGSQSTPGPVVGLDGTVPVVQLAMGNSHTCARLATGEVRCWGNGAIGNMSTAEAQSPVNPIGYDGVTKRAVWIGAGASATCAITDAGATECWGDNDVSGTASDVSVPTPIVGLEGTSLATTALEVSVGSRHACALTADGQTRCWGNGGVLGQLFTCNHGSSTAGPARIPPTSIGNVALSELVAGSSTCGVDGAGQLACFGANDRGQLGSGALLAGNPFPSAVDLPASAPATAALAGSGGAGVGGGHCAIDSNGRARCWGENSTSNGLSFLGIGADPRIQPVPTLNTTPDVASLALGRNGGCAATDTGEMYCWGSVAFLGGGSGLAGTVSPRLVPFFDGVARSAVDVTAGDTHVCAVLADGRVACWGTGTRSAHGSPDDELSPVFVAGFGSGAMEVAATSVATAGSLTTCAIVDGGAVYCWGANFSGNLGTGDTGISTIATPVPVVGIDGVAAVAVELVGGSSHLCARLATGEVRCWGENSEAELGNGLGTDAYAPVSVVGFDGTTRSATGLAAGDAHTCALDDQGGVWCWGKADFYRLGPAAPAVGVGFCPGCNAPAQCYNGFNCGYGEPVAVPLFDGVQRTAVDISASSDSTCVLAADGDVLCWGNNEDGTFGNGGVPFTCTPIGVELP